MIYNSDVGMTDATSGTRSRSKLLERTLLSRRIIQGRLPCAATATNSPSEVNIESTESHEDSSVTATAALFGIR